MLPHHVIDDFLDPAVADALLDRAIGSEDRSVPAPVFYYGDYQTDSHYRSARCIEGLDAELAAVGDAVNAAQPALCAALGMPGFAVSRTELGMVVHGDGDYLKTHVDVHPGVHERNAHEVRLMSCVYYLHRRPAGFSGGELTLHGFRGAAPIPIAPAHNRLLAFPSFVPHEVLPVSCPGDDFAGRRFSVNCWLWRTRAA